MTDPVPWTNSGFIWYLNFSKSVTNTMEGYNITTGVFRCEYPGLYLFTISIARDIGAHSCISCGFKVNHVYTSTAQACGNDLAHPFATNTIVTHLDKGGTVHIECFQALQISSYSTFSGVLLQSKHMA